ncbi:acidic mammalian chitinase-like [Sycon ciliatum]|uniref:acidic mammalian chitinase-like n=1 Tax=Sycon ciliatum TaxID=27933 RepID=UPI0020A9FB76|eukprot:scpid36349/ scgid10473/ Acidic mammalian chitinase; YNL
MAPRVVPLPFILVLLMVASSGFVSVTSTPIMGAYFANWAQYHTAPYTYTPENLAPIVGSLDHLMYAFAYIDPSSFAVTKVEPKDPQFYGEVMAYKKTNPNMKVLLSVGGWNMPSSIFSKMVSTKTNRAAFISSCVTAIKTTGFDGIDIDWEYPCSPQRTDHIKYSCAQFKSSTDAGGTCPQDTPNFSALLQEMRAAFGSTYMITVASQSAHKNWDKFDFKTMDNYIDYWHVMTYDYTVSDIANSSVTSPNCPLYSPPESSVVQWSLNYTVQGYLAAGVPASKIIIGIPLYGHTWFAPGLTGDAWKTYGLKGEIQGLCCGPFKQTYGAKYGKGCQLCGTMMVSEIDASGPQTFYDKKTETMIAYLPEDSSDGWTKAGTWITYNEETSAAAITKYAVDNKLAGVFVFDTSMDTMDFGSGTFTYKVSKTVRSVLNGGGPGPSPGSHVCTPAAQCNVCAACCKTYLKTQSDCDACVAQACPKTNVCQPSGSCTVCAACCKSYLKTQNDCDACVKSECT